ncbi:mercuric transporter MerT family protein [Moritella sp. F3]|uniref:mercuric transporter MerT family protein n=1 Tax=Moritella sp. F3 TaxID=2718882 RepID=UPI0018E19EA8|nr:mercuric transporter MerT family protein [Moritella sp. F3]GIC78688.1 mercury transporter [Moritella sp. F1]GIC81384.1 mercury transporter [Moritella sp. F3]
MENKASNLPLMGGLVAAIGAGLCCAGPLVLLLLGIGGSWIGNFTLFEPYRPFFILAVVGLFSWSGWKLYRPQIECQQGTPCAVPQVQTRRKITFWLASLIALILISSNYWVLWIT